MNNMFGPVCPHQQRQWSISLLSRVVGVSEMSLFYFSVDRAKYQFFLTEHFPYSYQKFEMKPLPASRLSIDFSDKDIILQFYLFASIRSTPLTLLRNDKTEVSSTEVLQDIICPPVIMVVYQGLFIIKLNAISPDFGGFLAQQLSWSRQPSDIYDDKWEFNLYHMLR